MVTGLRLFYRTVRHRGIDIVKHIAPGKMPEHDDFIARLARIVKPAVRGIPYDGIGFAGAFRVNQFVEYQITGVHCAAISQRQRRIFKRRVVDAAPHAVNHITLQFKRFIQRQT